MSRQECKEISKKSYGIAVLSNSQGWFLLKKQGKTGVGIFETLIAIPYLEANATNFTELLPESVSQVCFVAQVHIVVANWPVRSELVEYELCGLTPVLQSATYCQVIRLRSSTRSDLPTSFH